MLSAIRNYPGIMAASRTAGQLSKLPVHNWTPGQEPGHVAPLVGRVHTMEVRDCGLAQLFQL